MQIEHFIPPDDTRANYAGLLLHGAHRSPVKVKKSQFLGFRMITEASNQTKVMLYMGKKGFFGGFYPFPSKSESYTKFEKNW